MFAKQAFPVYKYSVYFCKNADNYISDEQRLMAEHWTGVIQQKSIFMYE
jgi:hypothetical protein